MSQNHPAADRPALAATLIDTDAAVRIAEDLDDAADWQLDRGTAGLLRGFAGRVRALVATQAGPPGMQHCRVVELSDHGRILVHTDSSVDEHTVAAFAELVQAAEHHIGRGKVGADPDDRLTAVPDVAPGDELQLLRRAAVALRAVGKAALVVKPTLDTPYPDRPEQTPWSRWMERPVRRAYNLGVEIPRWLTAANRAREEER